MTTATKTATIATDALLSGDIIRGIRYGLFSVVMTETHTAPHYNAAGVMLRAVTMTVVVVREINPETGEVSRRKMRFPLDMFDLSAVERPL